ncbi:MAG: L,D-transpeptidase [Pyrinomonadaceae bacterium]
MIKTLFVIFLLAFAATAEAQSYIVDSKRESARSDKFTGGIHKAAALVPGDGNVRITINLPSFQMTLWQNGNEVKTYPVGIGMLEFPVAISMRSARTIEWNPVWIPPSSDWIEASSTVKAGEIVLPTDPRNPLGKVKIPLGYGYLLHQAKGPADMGSLVSHGCIRVMQNDIYDLADKIVAARGLDVTSDEIASAKQSKKTLIAEMDPPLSVEITYDTIVVENGKLHVYPDVYQLKTNTVANVRNELRTNGIADSHLSDVEIRSWIAGARGKQQFEIAVADISAGRTARGSFGPVVGQPAPPSRSKTLPMKRRMRR